MKGKLNLFQRAMLRWRELHPYSAVHVVRIGLVLDEARLRSAIAALLEASGLTGLRVSASLRRFEYLGGAAAVDLRMAAPEGVALDHVNHMIETEINRPFPLRPTASPFRFFAVADGPLAFYLGLAYDHFIAGGDSICLLLKGIAERYGGQAQTPAGPLERYPPSYAPMFARNTVSIVRGLRHLGTMKASCRRSVRPRYRAHDDGSNGFRALALAPPALDRLTGVSKSWGVTLNDLLLALMLERLVPLVGRRDPRERRHEIAVASIMNIRRDFGSDPQRTFGQFLGSFRVAHAVPPSIGLRELAHDVHRETARIKTGKLYLQTLVALGLSGFAWKFLSTARKERLYAKAYPVWAGLSLLNVNALWNPLGTETVPEYIRAASTGPLAPMVMAVTTAGPVLHAGVTYRRSAFEPHEIDELAASFATAVERLA